MDAIGLIGGGAVVVVAAMLVVKYFPKQVMGFMRRASAQSATSIKKQSDQMLADMDRNVAERKARPGR